MLSTFGSQPDTWMTLFTVTCTVYRSDVREPVEFCASSLESLGSRRKDFPVAQTCQPPQMTPALDCLAAIKLPPTPGRVLWMHNSLCVRL